MLWSQRLADRLGVPVAMLIGRRGLSVLTKYRFKCSLEVFAPRSADLLTVVQLNPNIQFAIAAMGWPLEIDRSGFADWKRDLTALGACPKANVDRNTVRKMIRGVPVRRVTFQRIAAALAQLP